MEIVLVVVTLLYVAELLVLRIGLKLVDAVQPVRLYQPTVSVIVAARNEERLIGSCLSSLCNIEYPSEKLEIIVVNDGSTDRTLDIVNSFIPRDPRLKVITSKPGTGNLRGKTNAVAQGIAASSGEILMFTDADCRVPTGWVRETVGLFDITTGIVGGYTILESHTLFDGIQALDWIFLFSLAAAAIGWGSPLTAIGNNLAIRRSAYDEVGGYEMIPFSVTEDYSLVQTIARKTRYKARFPVRPETVVESQPCDGWKQLYNQKKRWGVGGLDMILRGKLIMAVGWTAKLVLICSVWFIPLLFWLVCLAAVLLGEFLLILKPIRRFGKISLLRYFPFFAVYLVAYVLLLPFIAIFSQRVVWKERQLIKDEK